MSLSDPPPRAPAANAGAGKPSLMGGSNAASTGGSGDVPTQPLRMLDGLQARPMVRPAEGGRRTTLVAVLALAMLAVAGYAWWDRSGRGVDSPGLIDASRQSRAADAPVATTAMTTPADAVAVAPPAASASPAASAAALDPSSGPASIERTAAADAKAAPAHPFASAAVPRDLDPFATTAIARPVPKAVAPTTPVATPPVAAPPAPSPFVAPRVAAAPRTAPRPVPAVVAQAPPPASGDPDVTLFSAMLARLSGDGTTATPRPTIAQLVERCEAQSAKDSIEAFECKRRICAGYWGKADACPMALAPKRD